eukprot:5625299-Alexandrium_andersonii.AAC.1
MGAALWALGRALCLLVLAAGFSVATRLAQADGGLKLYTRCASWAPEQAKCHLCVSTWGVRITAGALAACDVLQILCDTLGAAMEPYAFPPPRQSRG